MSHAIEAKSSRASTRAIRLRQMPRKRTSKVGEGLVLSFRAEEILISAVDEEAKQIATERRRANVSRSEAVKVLLWEALDSRRAKRSK